MKKTFINRILIGAVSLMLSAFTSQTPEFIILPAHTPIIVTLDNEIDAEDLADREVVKFSVERSVVVDYEKLVCVKSIAFGYVKKNDGNVLEIEMTGVQAVDDTLVPLSGTLRKERQSRRGTIAIKGGTSIEALVRENVKIKLSRR